MARGRLKKFIAYRMLIKFAEIISWTIAQRLDEILVRDIQVNGLS